MCPSRVLRAVALALAAATAIAGEEAAPAIRVRQGTLRGTIRAFKEGGEGRFMACKGIPYAKPPVGPLRFKDPVAAEPWEGERSCTSECPECCQPFNPVGGAGTFVKGKEDCLCLNVYTPYPMPTSAPVMVWIHGGAFVSGSGGELLYGPDFFVPTGVILVTLNYRLGALGFLDLDHDEAPGNQGLKDQNLALQWVRDNIEAFGGDPSNVTIFGESAGSASVHFHVLSPMSRGLFSGAIMQSGSGLNPWAWKRSSLGNAEQLLAAAGCDVSLVGDAPSAVECLRGVSASSISGSTRAFLSEQDKETFCDISFTPTLDDKFIPDDPCHLITESRAVPLVRTVSGFNSGEGIIAIPMLRRPNGTEAAAEALEKGKGLCLPCDRCPPTAEARHAWTAAVKRRYFAGKPFSMDTLQGYADYATYYMFYQGIHTALASRANTSDLPHFYYEFDVSGKLNFGKVLFGGASLKGAAHADELAYMFRNKLAPPSISKDSMEYLVRCQLIKLWTDFAKTGTPTPEVSDLIPVRWEKFNLVDEPYLYIGNEEIELKHFPMKTEREFFHELKN